MRMLRSYCLVAGAAGALALLAGCGHFLFAEREPWRHDAEVQCMSSGAVKEGPRKVRISPIEGPGVCGIDLPLKVSSLGGENIPLGYDDEPRPPGAIPNAGNGAPPRWPIAPSRPVSPSVTQEDLPAPAAGAGSRAPEAQPTSLDPPQTQAGAASNYDFRRPYQVTTSSASMPGQHPVSAAPSFTYGPASVPAAAPSGPVAVNPPATLACPLTSALDQWIDEAVQPAAAKWFGEPVIEIKQISAYSCRGMNGDPNATISEHAFGNALDIAAFTFADGRKLDVQHGWRGSPEEQAFLHDVQASACNQFTTVLAPGYNVYHYNHIHVDLMRRRSGRSACEPQPVSGDEVAARLGAHVAGRRGEPSVTGSINQHRGSTPAPRAHPPAYADENDRRPPNAVPGADGAD